MEGLPSGDITAKYQKLATEYSKLRVHVKVLKKGVLDEQAKSNELRETLKEREKSVRKGELEIESLTFRNQQLTRRVSVLQDELEALQLRLTKKTKGRTDDKQPSTSNAAPLDTGLLQEELQKKILENAQFASQLSDRAFEISQLKASLEDYQKYIGESDSKSKCEIAKLRNKNQELQLSLEEIQRDRVSGTPSKALLGSQAASCNGDFLSEGGSLLGSEDALSSVDDSNVNEQLSVKARHLEQLSDRAFEISQLKASLEDYQKYISESIYKENQKLRMEYGMLQLENESLVLEVAKHVSASQRRRGDGHDSGDFNMFSETSIDGEGRVTGLLGSLEVPFPLSHEVQSREDRMKTYFRNKISELRVERDELSSTSENYIVECDMLRLRLEELERDKQTDAATIQDKHNTISRLEEELNSTSHNYEEQMSVLTEHVAGLNEQLTKQHDSIEHLKHQLSLTRKK